MHRIQGGRQRLNCIRADDGTCQREFTAAEGVSADGNCQDRIQFHIKTDVIRIRRVDTAGSNQTGKTGTESTVRVGEENNHNRLDADKLGRPFIDTDRLDIHAQCRFLQK